MKEFIAVKASYIFIPKCSPPSFSEAIKIIVLHLWPVY